MGKSSPHPFNATPVMGRAKKRKRNSATLSLKATKKKENGPTFKKTSLWSIVKEELAGDNKANELIPIEKLQQVYNFVNVLFYLEKALFFGFWVCLDSFLYMFSFLPIRFALFFLQALWSILTFKNRISKRQWFEFIQGCIFILTSILLIWLCDSSHAYHWIRQQQAIRLYVLFSILEVRQRCKAE